MFLFVFGFCYFLVVFSIPIDDVNLEAIDNGFLFQGDMVMTKQEIQTAINGGDVDNIVTPGYALRKSTRYRWKDGVVPYVLHTSVKNKVLNKLGIKGPTERAIRNAMEAWEKKTCIRFIERTNEKDYIEFFDGGFGKCYSHVGRLGVGMQHISLGFGCFTTGTVIHEIGHALGLHHEQSRPDRDQFVEILWNHIPKDKWFAFTKYSNSRIDSLGSPYDYGSIMHYEWNAFGKIPLVQRTIRSKVKGSPKLGQRSHISTQDAWQINKYYECKQTK